MLCNYNGNTCTKSFAAFSGNHAGHKRQFQASSDCCIHLHATYQVDCWFYSSFWGSTTSCSSHHTQRLFQVDCYLFQYIPSHLRRLRYILWGRMGATAATRQTHQPCWPWPYQSPWSCRISLSQWPHRPCLPDLPLWPYRPHPPYWPHRPFWPNWPRWSHQLHLP